MPTVRPEQFFQKLQTIWPWPKPKSLIGLDVGSQRITFVEAYYRQGRHRVGRWGSEPLELNVIEQGRITNRSALIAALRAFVEKYGLKGSSVAMAVNGASVMVKRIHISKRHRRNLEGHLMWEGARYIPYDPDDVYLDFSLCSSGCSNGANEGIDVLLVAAKRDAVDERRDVLEEVGLHPIICDVEALAFLNLAALHPQVRPHSSYLIANLLGNMMTLVVVIQGEPVLVRDVSVSFSSSQDFAGWTPENSVQRPYGVHLSQEQESFLSHKIGWREIEGELRRTIGGARELLPDLNMEQMFLCGGLRARPGFQEELGRSLMIPASFIDPLDSFGRDGESEGTRPFGPFAGVAGGLALRRNMNEMSV